MAKEKPRHMTERQAEASVRRFLNRSGNLLIEV